MSEARWRTGGNLLSPTQIVIALDGFILTHHSTSSPKPHLWCSRWCHFPFVSGNHLKVPALFICCKFSRGTFLRLHVFPSERNLNSADTQAFYATRLRLILPECWWQSLALNENTSQVTRELNEFIIVMEQSLCHVGLHLIHDSIVKHTSRMVLENLECPGYWVSERVRPPSCLPTSLWCLLNQRPYQSTNAPVCLFCICSCVGAALSVLRWWKNALINIH